jgi:hypothetical protein
MNKIKIDYDNIIKFITKNGAEIEIELDSRNFYGYMYFNCKRNGIPFKIGYSYNEFVYGWHDISEYNEYPKELGFENFTDEYLMDNDLDILDIFDEFDDIEPDVYGDVYICSKLEIINVIKEDAPV